MPAQFVRTRIRCVVDISKRTTKFKDKSGQVPAAFRGTGMQFELAFFYGNELVDISNFSSVSITVKAATALTGAALMTKTVGADNLNATLTREQWDAGTDQHVIVKFASTETAIGDGGADVDYHLVVHGLTTDDAIDNDTFGISTLKLIEDGTNNAESPLPAGPVAMSRDEVLALLQGYQKVIADPGQTQTFRSPSDTYRRIIGINDTRDPIDIIEENTPEL
jgi:hypothetical protein